VEWFGPKVSRYETVQRRSILLSYDRTALADIRSLFDELRSSPDGLSTAQAKIRLDEYGPNVLPSAKRPHAAEKFLAQFKNLFNVVLLVASLLSFMTGWVYSDPTSFQMAFAILGVVLVNACFSVIQEYRAEKAVQAIANLIPANAKVLRDGELKELSVAVVPGDVITLDFSLHQRSASRTPTQMC
jgi:magnesium-transporting ATPase (P-type)